MPPQIVLTYLYGVGLGLSLIIAIGAQNVFVLRQGIRREHVVTVALICAVSDALLIAIGVSGVGVALQAVPWLVDVVRWVGVAFLTTYGALALRRAYRPSGDALDASERAVEGDTSAPTPERVERGSDGGVTTTTVTATPTAPSPYTARSTLAATVGTALALTWLNPHVYLDTVFLLGSLAQSQGGGRWVFAAGAVTASFAWFFGLALGARLLGPWLATPRAWRLLDVGVAVVMGAIAANLAFAF